MFGTLSEEVEVKVPASKAWALYGTLELGKLIAGKVFEAVDVVEGEGGTGTILKLTLKPGLGFTYYKEKFTKIDNEKMIKETEVVEGGFLDFGFSFYRIKFRIIENPNDDTGSSCLLKVKLEYDVKEEFAANASLVTTEPLVAIMSVANEHLLKSLDQNTRLGFNHLPKNQAAMSNDGSSIHQINSSNPIHGSKYEQLKLMRKTYLAIICQSPPVTIKTEELIACPRDKRLRTSEMEAAVAASGNKVANNGGPRNNRKEDRGLHHKSTRGNGLRL